MPVTFQQHVLPNGLRIVAERDDLAHTSAIGFFVKTGARDERPALMGVSHFLEHMMFKGTDKRTSDDVNREFDAIGARSNAYTSSELTAFHAAVLPEHLVTATDILADMMRPALRDDDFGTERGVILEEIAMYDDDPTWVLYERLVEEHYQSHPLAHRVLGTKQTIADMLPAQMRGYFADRYSADNTVVALAGRVDFHAACKQIESLCGHWQRTSATRTHVHPTLINREMTLHDEKVTRAYRMMVAEGAGMGDPLRYDAWVATQLLGGPDNSKLHWSLIETGLAEEADCSLENRDGIGDLRVFIACEPDALDRAWAIVEDEIAHLGARITEADVDRIKAKVATGVTVAGERPDGRMHRLGRQWSYLGQYSTLDEELAKINAVTVDTVRKSLKRFPMTPRTIGTLLPKG